MQEYRYNNLSSFLANWQDNTKYFDMLRLMAQLSKLFSENEVPYLDYRLAENLFCKYFDAANDARSCTAYDARLMRVGIGIKTFVLKGKHGDYSVEKIAEFNKLKKTLNGLSGIDLALQIGKYRNERMEFANNQYDVNETQYHIVGRVEGTLRLFNTPYEFVNLEKLHLDKDDETSCSFNDETNEYTFNKSKSALLKRFEVPSDHKDIPVDILDDPLSLLEEFFADKKEQVVTAKKLVRGEDYLILPLYSFNKKRGCFVAEKSGLNQFNAGGRKRNDLEVYIPVPMAIRNIFPNFFPSRDIPFTLLLPDGKKLSAKICQDGGKALMSNPNSALGEWILRKVLKKRPWELVTMNDLDRLGFDSICVENMHCIDNDGNKMYKISFSNTNENFQSFINDDQGK
ncbi:MAG: NgoFVII family restriction endonuclease [Bacteroidales bacterium]|nr:NgoFVII family restriction endonuclease [Bacteroidales bacterium]